MVRYVYDFTEGSRAQAGLLGGKGANLAEMTALGLPVPPGFTITTEACRAFLTTGELPQDLSRQTVLALRHLEQSTGRRLGQADDPLLLSVRSGARYSMPGMMDTILDVGLNDTAVHGLAKHSGRERFAWDSYRRLIQMYGSTVMGIDESLFEEALAGAKKNRGTTDDLHLGTRDVIELVAEFKTIVRAATGTDFPQDPDEQLEQSVLAVFRSWNSARAQVYRRRERIPDGLGTAVNIQAMVYGNLGPDSGTGVAFTRDPATGRAGVYGEYLPDAQGEDVVAGIRNAVPLKDLRDIDALSYERLLAHMELLEQHYRDLCDVEFTIERGRLWLLQTRIGKRTAQAAFRIAAELVDEGQITWEEALLRVGGAQLAQLMFPRFDERAAARPLARGIPASPGAAVGAVVFDSTEAVRRAGAGERVVLVREETTPDDLPGMIAAQAVLTSRGGKTSHAAVVARGMGKVCVCGADGIRVDLVGRRFTTGAGQEVTEGCTVSVDGTAGTVHLGALPLVDSPVMRYLEAGEQSAGPAQAVDRALRQADAVARLEVRANADTPQDAARARRFGARGIGLCRTEHMFLGERRRLVEDMILARTDSERQSALDALLPLQRADFIGILAAMDGLPVTIRLLDPPLHEFLPDPTELAVRVASAKAAGGIPDAREVQLLEAVERMREQNPMLGLRGVRLTLTVPGLTAMQVRAIGEAVVARVRAGGAPRAEIMVPLVGTHEELRAVRTQVEAALSEVFTAAKCTVNCPVGTMIELPRAALTAARIARHADFFSFGTNDLTQTTWGFSRDDAEASFFAPYLDQGILSASPFETLDEDGVGRLVRIAVDEGRAARPGLTAGVCGEHGGDPESIRFFHSAGLDYISCSPFRVPGARLEAGRAALSPAGRYEQAET
ncbi:MULTISPECIES: pyruvate, phosphate dikinase [Streptomyces]|uniref:pyruvate, phosphate dikinase n=1 Tax=Streptomyces TaxID=1883 RepID=UPI0004CCC4B1|nr:MULTISPECIES: pyruvate, phosphate dikinase [Streptomyces]KOT51385.1 pyruvate phosphate dikinase [Streptomyces rimosus subsp. rimosus]